MVSRQEAILLGKISITAGIYTTAIFVIFSVFSLLTCRRMNIFFFSAISCLVLSLFSFLFVSSIFVESLIGLAVGILYVIVDTQMIIYKTESGKYDTFGDAKELFIGMIYF